MASSKKKAARKASPARGATKRGALARRPAPKASAKTRTSAAAKPAVSGPSAARPPASKTLGTKAVAVKRAVAKTFAKKPLAARRVDKPVARPVKKPAAGPLETRRAAPGRSRTAASDREPRRPAAAPAPTALATAVAPGAAGRVRPGRASVSRGRTGADELQELGGPAAVPGLSEEDQIRAAKYLPRELPKRVFEEERFVFPESYGLNRIRLLVRDPEWIFAYWDVNPEAMKDLGRRLGERSLALSRLTLRVLDPVSGASSDILLPPGARWWYVRTDSARRTYRAELGVTVPSGEFHRLAESNTVVTPRVGPSAERARRRISYPESRAIPLSAAEAALSADQRSDVAREPWLPGTLEGAAEPVESERQHGGEEERKGGASDAFRSGASDAFRPGASDAFRR